jgi:hypothetical protein
MAQSGYTPILIYASGTATNVPLATNMTSSANGAELALNYADGKLYFKNSSNIVTLLASSASTTPVTTFSAGTTGLTPNSATSGAITLAGTLAVANGGTGLTATPTNGQIDIGNGTGFTRTTLTQGSGVTITNAAGSITIAATGSGGTVTSVAASVPSFLSIIGSPITSSGTLAISYSGTALPVANGGTGVTSSTGSTSVVLSTSPTILTPTIRKNLSVISGNTSAVASYCYVIVGSLTLTLPASPTAGDWVEINNSSGTTTPVVARNGQNIESLAQDLTIDNATASFTLTFSDATRGWVLTL